MAAFQAIPSALREAAMTGVLRGPRVLAGVSGGIDSVVLAHALAMDARALGVGVVVGHVHHGLRGEAADADAQHAEALANQLGVGFEQVRIDPEALRVGRSSRERPTLEEAARKLRRRALLEMTDRASCEQLVLAQHADDQVETVLLRLLRGCGPDALGGMAPCSRDGRVARPLLDCSRSQIEAYASHHRLMWREDASNRDVRHARNRLRHDWLPGLRDHFNPQLLRAITGLAEAQRRDREWIEAQVSDEAARRFRSRGRSLVIARSGWASLPEALRRRLARQAMIEMGAGREVSRIHLQRIGDFLATGRTGAIVELPDGLRLRCFCADEVTLERVEPEAAC